jgi:hypothetical protein
MRDKRLTAAALLALSISGALSGLVLGGGGPASASGGTTVGPVQINPVGHPRLCWQATGNGAPIVLETCDSAVVAQQWSLTPDGVMMSGIGYCLEARPGQPAGVPLYIDFAGQCAGGHGQVWRYNGTTGRLSSLGTCAALGGSPSSGTEIVRRSCPRGPRWSIGYSAVTLKAGTGNGAVGGPFDVAVTIANAASAQTAYGVTMVFGRLPGLAVTGFHVAGGASGFRCNLSALTCTGTLLAGAPGRIGVTGRLPASARPGHAYTLTARALVRGTSQLPGMSGTIVPVTVSVHAAPPALTGSGPSSGVYLLAGLVAVLLLAGGLLVGLTLRRRPVHAGAYEGRRRRAGVRLPRLDVAVAHPPGQLHPEPDRRTRIGARADVDVGVAHGQVVDVHHDARPEHQDQGSATPVQIDVHRVGPDDRLGEVEYHVAPRHA